MLRIEPCIGRKRAVGVARASSPAGTASTERRAQQQKRVDFLTGFYGLSLPTLFKRIGTMAADGRPSPTRIHATPAARSASQACHGRRQPARRTGSAVRTACAATPTSIASGPAEGLATGNGSGSTSCSNRHARSSSIAAAIGPFHVIGYPFSGDSMNGRVDQYVASSRPTLTAMHARDLACVFAATLCPVLVDRSTERGRP